MSSIIDRRLNGKNKSTVNRQRFLRRFKNQIKKAVTDAVSKRSITDIDKGEKINIPSRDISEPTFHHANTGGKREMVHPGNKEFTQGDRIARPEQGGGQGQGGEASNEGEGEDDFAFELSREEFLELFFEDLALPDLVKKQMAREPAYKMVRAGFANDGVPANLNITRSMRASIARRIALTTPYRRKLKRLESELAALLASDPDQLLEIDRLKKEIKQLKTKINAVPFLDTFDLKYNHRVKKPMPSTQAAMFCIMDVSGSMDEAKKEIAKRFFIMLYLFLNRNYEHIDLIFIRHHTSAKEVDEQEFFYSRETGGTVVSSALELCKNIIHDRYPSSDWNLYVAQASDGDNWNADSPHCRDLLLNDIMPAIQYFTYVEIMPRHHQSLWHAYEEVKANFENFAMESIHEQKEIYAVFRELFKRQAA